MIHVLRLMLLFLFVALAPTTAARDVALQGKADGITSDVFRIEGFESSFELTGSGVRGAVRIERITLTDGGDSLDNILVACESLRLMTQSVECSRATFTADFPIIGRQTIAGSFAYDALTETTRLSLLDVAVANSEMQLDVVATDAGVAVEYQGEGLDLGLLAALPVNLTEAFSDYSASGQTDIRGTLNVPADGQVLIKLQATLVDAAIANTAGTIATDGIHAELFLDIADSSTETRFGVTFRSDQGEVYIEPVYANFAHGAFTLNATDIVTTNFRDYTIPDFQMVQKGLLSVEGSSTLSFGSNEEESLSFSADLELGQSSVENLYSSLLQVVAAGTVLGDLETAGTVSGRLVMTDNAPSSARLTLSDVILDDQSGRYAVYGLNGFIDWSIDPLAELQPSVLRWDSGVVYSLIVEGGELEVMLGDNDLELLNPLAVETMGGALVINELKLEDFGEEDASGRLDAELQPIQLGQLSGAFGWPAFSGTLSGKLPLLTLAENTITVGGTLSARAFDGRMDLSNLRIEQPFGRVPRLRADLAIRDLDLQHVTEVFSFGLIQGRLSGDVTGLELQRWSPVSMDLHVYSSGGDKSERRISQRAVENLTSVGGGGAAAILSTGFLQFFDVFAYDQIGIRCVLANGACAMSGVGEAKAGPQGRGYYLVKGRGLPRIDVVGYRDTVSWTSLVQQLSAITRSGSPTVN